MEIEVCFAYCTFPDEKTARDICTQLVDDHTVACANLIGPMRAIYKWNGKLNDEAEWIAILKTRSAKRATLMEKVRAAHPYENPCLVFLPVSDGLPAFLNWIYAQSL